MGIISIFPFFQGVNELHIVFLLDVILLALLFYKVYKNKKLIITKDIKFILILLWSFSYLVTTFYAVDTELAFLGFLKFFTVPIFLVLVMQYDTDERNKWFEAIGKIGAVMVVICIITALVGQKDLFFLSESFSGIF